MLKKKAELAAVAPSSVWHRVSGWVQQLVEELKPEKPLWDGTHIKKRSEVGSVTDEADCMPQHVTASGPANASSSSATPSVDGQALAARLRVLKQQIQLRKHIAALEAQQQAALAANQSLRSASDSMQTSQPETHSTLAPQQQPQDTDVHRTASTTGAAMTNSQAGTLAPALDTATTEQAVSNTQAEPSVHAAAAQIDHSPPSDSTGLLLGYLAPMSTSHEDIAMHTDSVNELVSIVEQAMSGTASSATQQQHAEVLGKTVQLLLLPLKQESRMVLQDYYECSDKMLETLAPKEVSDKL